MREQSNIGIYIITNTVTGNSYIGASSNLKRRKYHHLRSLHCGYAHNTEMLVEYQATGSANNVMDFRVVEYCAASDLSTREKAHISEIKPVYNAFDGGGGLREVTDEFREKQRQRWTGKQMRKVGSFITPWGAYPSSMAAAAESTVAISQSAIWKMCRKSTIRISRQAYVNSVYLQQLGETVVGQTWADLGFGFIADGAE